MGHWHTRDLTDFDIVPIATPIVKAAQRATEQSAEIATTVVKEATYITVGLGLLAFQRAQVRRREIERLLRR